MRELPDQRGAALGLVLAGAAVLGGCGSNEDSGKASEGVTMSAAPVVPAAAEATPPGAAGQESGAGPASVSSEPAPSEVPASGPLPIDGAAQPGAAPGGMSAEEAQAPGMPPPPAVDPKQLPALTLWIAGDSTVANGQTPCPRGWGGVIGARLDSRVTVNNSAAGGRSVHTWLYNVGQEKDATGECVLERDAAGEPTLQPRWQAMLDGMKPGDYLFIQFGINDGDPSCDRHVGLDAFEAAYGMMAEAAKARGARPVFLTPVSSISCNGNTARGSRGEFVTRTIEAGARFDVPVIDLHARSVALYNQRGFCPVAGGDVSAATTGPVGDFFCDDHTHFSSTGAVEIAGVVAQALRDQGIPLSAYLK
ncbi:MAG TPA: GDSL-type esterase/lipase family protein [Polyangiaceae bacterium]|nr:GDSL-type esterase/lipase family protein [Polyangiaceae bacterium]